MLRAPENSFFLNIAGRPALDFLNTTLAPSGQKIERIPDTNSVLQWMLEASILQSKDKVTIKSKLSSKDLLRLHVDSIELREKFRNLMFLVKKKGAAGIQEVDLRYFNDMFRRSEFHHVVTTSCAGCSDSTI